MDKEEKEKRDLEKEYEDLKKQRVLDKGPGWEIEIACRPILPGHLMVYAIDENREKKIEGGLKDQPPETLKKLFDGVIKGIELLEERLDPKPERIYLGCFSDSGELHCHLYPVLPNQKPYDGHALDWLSSHERRTDKISKDVSQISERDLKKFIQHIDWTLKKFQKHFQFSKNN